MRINTGPRGLLARPKSTPQAQINFLVGSTLDLNIALKKKLDSRPSGLPLSQCLPKGSLASFCASLAGPAEDSHCLSQRKYAHPPRCFSASAGTADAVKQWGGCAYLR